MLKEVGCGDGGGVTGIVPLPQTSNELLESSTFMRKSSMKIPKLLYYIEESVSLYKESE